MSKPTIYFAHPITMYRTPVERAAIKALEEAGYTVVNPSDDDFADAFEAYRNEHPNSYMQFFVDRCNACDEVAFMCFPDDVEAEGVPQVPNRVGAGVMLEVESFMKRQSPVHHIPTTGPQAMRTTKGWETFHVLSVDETVTLLETMDPDYRNWRNQS